MATLAAVLVISIAGCATGEWATDIYAGPNVPLNEDVTVSIGSDFDRKGIADIDGKATVGARVGRWCSVLDALDLGLFVDASGMWQNVGGVDVTSVPVTALSMARVPLASSNEFPHGQVHPYVGVGPSGVWSQVDERDFTDDTVDVGLDVRAGISLLFIREAGVFLEYRFTYFEPEFTESGAAGNLRARMDSLVNHVLFGIALRF